LLKSSVLSSGFPRPRANRISRSLRRCSRRTVKAFVGSEMVRRPCAVLGALKRRPLRVSSIDRSTRTVAASRSTSLNRRASSSPRRMPVPTPATAIGYSGCPSSFLCISSICFVSSISISAASTLGGETAAATFRDRSSVSTARASARCRTWCAWPTVLAASGPPRLLPDFSSSSCHLATLAGRSFCRGIAGACQGWQD